VGLSLLSPVLVEAAELPTATASERSLVEARIRRRTFALQLGVLGIWGAGTVALALLLTLATLGASGPSDPLVTALMFAALSMTVLAPGGAWAGRAIKQRDSAARMALVAGDDPALDSLVPALRALIADARLVRSAIEGREFDDEVALRSAWEWLQRLAELPEADRRALEGHGLDDLGVAETLRWTIAEPDRNERGLALIAERLGAFERGLLAARGPYR
jgi:hypothetical protein